MAMDQSALLEMLEALKAADVGDRIRQATEKLYQELIDAEAAAVSSCGAVGTQRGAGRSAQWHPP